MASEFENILESLGGEKRILYSLDKIPAPPLKALEIQKKKFPRCWLQTTTATTTLLVSSALEESNLRIVTYLSPHLQFPNERILTGLSCIDPNDLTRLAREHVETAKKYELTYFEFMTLLAFLWAVETRADILVLEVGLGGRLDATNVTRPLAALLTNISFDHQQFLGNTLEEISRRSSGCCTQEVCSLQGFGTKSFSIWRK